MRGFGGTAESVSWNKASPDSWKPGGSGVDQTEVATAQVVLQPPHDSVLKLCRCVPAKVGGGKTEPLISSQKARNALRVNKAL